MLSKTAPCFALVITGTFSEFLACITVLFLFCYGEMFSKTALSFALVPSSNSKLVTSSFPFFCWGKMLSKTALSVALVVTGTFSEFVACITVVFFFAMVKWSLKLHFRLPSYLLRILSVYCRRLLFSAGVKCSQKPLPALRLSLQVPSLNSKRVLPSSSFFAGVKWSLKLHFCLRSYLIRIVSVYYRRFLFLLG